MEDAPFAWVVVVLAAVLWATMVVRAWQFARDEVHVRRPWGWLIVAAVAAFGVYYVALVALTVLR